MLVFHTDLDNTIIYSYKHDIGVDKVCTEVYQGREISFITQNTFRLLKKMKTQKTGILIVPTTTRTIEQYKRIDLGVGAFKYALVCNGGVLLVDGVEDKVWYKESVELIKDSITELKTAMEMLKAEKSRDFEIRFIKDLFIFTKCTEPESVVEKLRKATDFKSVDVFNNGVKVYVVPKALSKGKAVDRFRKYIGADYIIAAGDSEFDVSMLKASDFGIAAPQLVRNGVFLGSELSRIKCPSTDKLFAEAVLETVFQASANGQ